MEEENKKKKFYQKWKFWAMVIVLLAIISVIFPLGGRSNLKIYEEICGEGTIELIGNTTSCHQVEVNEIWFWHDDLDGNINKELKISGYEVITKRQLSKHPEWLDENCECIEHIEYTPNSAENSNNVPCSKYSCGEKDTHKYTVEVKK